jgi:KipI family sensor histidine kinase inhibitor
MIRPRIFPLGDNAVVCELPPPATLACQQRIWVLAGNAMNWPHVVDVVAGMNNLTVIFDPLSGLEGAPRTPAGVVDAGAPPPLADRLGEQLAAGWRDAERVAERQATSGKIVEIPVQYGGTDGPDLGVVAEHAGMMPATVAECHAAAEYIVFFIGFQPGFAYLGGLDERLHTPRRAEPRVRVPIGSVAIGGAQTGIYPSPAPGGWQLIGRSEKILFDPALTPPSALQQGDRVRFTIAGVTL